MSIDRSIAGGDDLPASDDDLPFPDELLVLLASSDLGMEPNDARALARSMGWVEVPGGWRAPIQ